VTTATGALMRGTLDAPPAAVNPPSLDWERRWY
jgi:hypothetical protein